MATPTVCPDPYRCSRYAEPFASHELNDYLPGASNVVDIYNGLTGSWSAAILSMARSFLSAASLPAQGLLLFAGGRASKGASSRIDIFNAITGLWIIDELSVAREGLAGNCLPFQNLVIFAGGGTDSGIGLFRARFFVFCVMSFPRTFVTLCIFMTHTREGGSSAVVDFFSSTFSSIQKIKNTLLQDPRSFARCNSCPAGFFSGPGDLSCIICPAGYFLALCFMHSFT